MPFRTLGTYAIFIKAKLSDVKLLNILLMLGTGVAFSTCRGDLRPVTAPTYNFFIQNNSADTFKYSFNILPDTSILNNIQSVLIYPGQLSKIYFPTLDLPDFKTTGTIEIFLFNIDTLQKYPWQTVMSKYLITKRYDLTYDSIMATNSVIKYP